MALSPQEVEHIADLARLELTDAEKVRYQKQLSEILNYVARLQVLDTSQIPPTSSALHPQSILRPDHARPGLALEDLLRNAPDTAEDQFRIPPVLE
jgi:aspartyl-tRNA(Asn)/glutamyl-tRNA(Gln) amidotransferase subunit C